MEKAPKTSGPSNPQLSKVSGKKRNTPFQKIKSAKKVNSQLEQRAHLDQTYFSDTKKPKEGGIQEGSVWTDKQGRLYMVKPINNDAKQNINDYAAGLLYEFILFSKAPRVGLVTGEDGQLYMRSQFLEEAVDLVDYLTEHSGSIEDLEGVSEVVFAVQLLGECDTDDGNNLMVFGKEGERKKLAKIDHGQSFSLLSSKTVATAYTQAKEISQQLKFDDYCKVLSEKINTLSDDQVDDILDKAIYELKKNGIDNVAFLEDHKLAVKHNKAQLQKMLKRAALIAGFPEKIKNSLWKQLLIIKDFDPLEHAIKEDIEVYGQNAFKWAIENAYEIDEIDESNPIVSERVISSEEGKEHVVVTKKANVRTLSAKDYILSLRETNKARIKAEKYLDEE